MLEEYTYEYIPFRGLTPETLRLYDIKTKIDKDGKPVSIGFPYANESFKVRLLDKKEFYSVGDISKAGLFARDKFPGGSHKYVAITEGETDAASLHQVLRFPVVSVQSSSSAVRDCTIDRAYLNTFERIYLAFDADAAGREATRSVARLFDNDRTFVLNFDTRKDANEYLKHGEEDVLRNIWHNSRRYLPENIVSSLDDFDRALTEKPKEGVPYPFECLNKMLFGLRTGETVLIKAQEKVGKTEVMHFIEHQLLTGTDKNVGAIYLEEGKQRHLQALAGIQLRAPVHLPDNSHTEDQVAAALRQVVQRDDRLYIYSNFGGCDRDVLLDTIRFLVSARGCRYILLDHLTMAVIGVAEEDERRQLDWLSTKLEMLVKELDFSLIMVSHVNDLGQTRGSRYPTKVADITIDLSRDMMAEDPIVRRTINISVPYNRFSGNTGYAGSIIFHPETYSFEEVVNAKFLQNDVPNDSPKAVLRREKQKETVEVRMGIPANDNSPQREERAVA